MEYLVHQGDSLDIVWPMPGVTDTPDGGINLDMSSSSSYVELSFSDGTKQKLTAIKDWGIVREIATGKVDAVLSMSDTSIWPVGDIEYSAVFKLKDGAVSNSDAGVITVLEPNGDPQRSDTKPWDLLLPWAKVVTDEVKAERLSICQECPQFDLGSRRCEMCGCFMDAKSTLASSNCPLGKWGVDDGVTRKERKQARKSVKKPQ